MLTLVNITVCRPDAMGIDRIWQHWSIKPLLNLSSTESLVIFSTRFSTLVDNICLFFTFLVCPSLFSLYLSALFPSFPFFCLFSIPFTFFDLLSSASVFLCHFFVLAAAAFFSVFFGLIDNLFFCFKRLSLLSARGIHCYQKNQMHFTVVILFWALKFDNFPGFPRPLLWTLL